MIRYNWSGNLTSLQKATITIPNISYTVLATNLLSFRIPNDANATSNNGLVTFAKPNEGNNVISLNFTPDAYGEEISSNFMDSSGTILAFRGPYTAGDSIPVTITITLLASDCYTFNIMDLYGDGIGNGANPVTVNDSNNDSLFYSNGLYGSGVLGNFSAPSLLANDNFEVTNKTKLFPNPSTGIVKIDTQETFSLSVIDVLGKLVYTNNQVDNPTNIDLTNLQKGVYLVKVISEKAYSTEKLFLE